MQFLFPSLAFHDRYDDLLCSSVSALSHQLVDSQMMDLCTLTCSKMLVFEIIFSRLVWGRDAFVKIVFQTCQCIVLFRVLMANSWIRPANGYYCDSHNHGYLSTNSIMEMRARNRYAIGSSKPLNAERIQQLQSSPSRISYPRSSTSEDFCKCWVC